MESDIKLGYKDNETGIFKKDYVVIEGERVIIPKSLSVPEIANDVYFTGVVEVGGQVKAGILNVEEKILVGRNISCGGDAEISGKLAFSDLSDLSGSAITIDSHTILVERRHLLFPEPGKDFPLTKPGKALVESEVLDLIKEVLQLREDIKKIQKKLEI